LGEITMQPVRTTLAIVAAVVLTGCHPPGKTAASSGSEGAAATPANVALTPKGAPQRRDGYWEMATFTETGAPMRKQYICVDAASEKGFSIFDEINPLSDCAKREFTRTATGWTFESQCTLMKDVTVQKGTISGDFQQSFLVDQTVTEGDHVLKGTIHGKHIGACPAQFKPGDLVDGDGQKLGNMLPQ
jgi:hypothetical protein